VTSPQLEKPSPEEAISLIHNADGKAGATLTKALQNAGIKLIGELVLRTEGEMLKTKNFGRKSLKEIRDILTEMDLQLGMKIDKWDQLLGRWKKQQGS